MKVGRQEGFVLGSDGRDDDVVGAFRRYQHYLATVKDKFPRSAYALATSDWYFNFQDHRCPHDAWLESFNLLEASSGERSDVRTLSLKVRLLGAYHDGIIELRYPRIFAYRLNLEDGDSGHHDWRYDEFRLSDRATVIHEIEWCGLQHVGTWFIEASDVEFAWFS